MNNINLKIETNHLTKNQVIKAIELLDKIATHDSWLTHYNVMKNAQIMLTDTNEILTVEQFREICLKLYLVDIEVGNGKK